MMKRFDKNLGISLYYHTLSGWGNYTLRSCKPSGLQEFNSHRRLSMMRESRWVNFRYITGPDTRHTMLLEKQIPEKRKVHHD